MQTKSIWRHFDLWLTAAVIMLTAYGILMIRSAVTGAPAQANFPTLQTIWLIAGITVLLIMSSIDYRLITAAHWYFYIGFILSLIFVFAAGTINNSARRWIDFGLFQLQPSELGRIFLLIAYAQFLTSRLNKVHDFRNTIITLIYIGIPVSLIFIEPDLGMSILYFVMWFIMIWMAGLPLLHFIVMGGGGIAFAIGIFPFLADYQQDRINSFISQESFNVEQAVTAVGTGGWFGKGYFNGSQSQLGFLRVQPTDFIFSMIVEEMGFFFGAVVVLALILFILWRILKVATITKDPVGQLACAGIAGLLFFQTVVSVGMNLQVLPVTGLTLPFVSYGGSSLLTWYMTIGVVQSIRMRHRKQEFG